MAIQELLLSIEKLGEKGYDCKIQSGWSMGKANNFNNVKSVRTRGINTQPLWTIGITIFRRVGETAGMKHTMQSFDKSFSRNSTGK